MSDDKCKITFREGTVSVLRQPPIVGYWHLPGSKKPWETKLAQYNKPRWLTRKLAWWLLELRWEDPT